MSVKAKLEAIVYATEEPVTLNQLALLLKDAVLAELHTKEEVRLASNEIVAERPVPNTHEVEAEFGDNGEAEDASAEVASGNPVRSANSSDAGPGGETESHPHFYDGKELNTGDLTQEQQYQRDKDDLRRVKEHLHRLLDELTAEYASSERGMEVRQVAGGYRMATKPEHHDVVVSFAKSLKPPVRLSLQALETLAVIAYKQPVTVPEISEIRGVDSSGVIATLLDRKLITTGGRKQVIGRPILYKTTKEFLLRFGLRDVSELPSMEEFEKLGDPQAELFTPAENSTAGAVRPSEKEGNARGTETASADEVSNDDDQPVTEAVPELTGRNNSNAGSSPTGEAPAELNEPERFNEAVAPVPGVVDPKKQQQS